MTFDYEIFMNRALALAKEAADKGEVPVGAVIVKDGKIISEGRNRREESRLCTAHAEIEALEAACKALGTWRLDGCTLYVTLEPCPMCSGAISASRITQIVYGASDKAAGALGGSFSINNQIGGWNPTVTGGVLEDECSALLSDFFSVLRSEIKPKRLNRDFYTADVVSVAQNLLGKTVCVKDKSSGEIRRGRISETEAYLGESDSASHAHKGMTDRNRPMYDKGGTVYVYLCYGIHSLLNIVTGPKGKAEAVLIRGIDGIKGPGKVTKALGIDRRFNNSDVVLSDEIWIEDDFTAVPDYISAPRVGIDYAEEKDRNAKLRFIVQ